MKYPETGSTQGTRFVLNVPVRRARGRRISTDGALEPPPTRRSRCHRIIYAGDLVLAGTGRLEATEAAGHRMTAL
jgi:hypothetical protein